MTIRSCATARHRSRARHGGGGRRCAGLRAGAATRRPRSTPRRTRKAKTEAAQQKNAEALDQRPGAGDAAAAPARRPPAAPRRSGAGRAAAPAAPTAPATPYDPAGRRDPFVSLLGARRRRAAAGRGARRRACRTARERSHGEGRAQVAEEASIALVQAPDNRTYIMHAGDKVFDGTVKAITQDAVVFSQDVNDPLSLVKQREVRKSDSTGGTVNGAETKMTVFKKARAARRLLAACAIATAVGGGLGLAAAPAAAVRLVGVSAQATGEDRGRADRVHRAGGLRREPARSAHRAGRSAERERRRRRGSGRARRAPSPASRSNRPPPTTASRSRASASRSRPRRPTRSGARAT